jgi:hypothetical protein
VAGGVAVAGCIAFTGPVFIELSGSDIANAWNRLD